MPGCNNKLNVQPVSTIDAATAFATSSNALAGPVGCYAGLQSPNLYGGYLQFLTDLLADNGDESFVGTFTQPQEAQRKTLLLTNTQVSATWLSAHDVINRPNNVLANLGKLDTPAQQASAEGEAKFIRSLVYFNLVSTRLVFPIPLPRAQRAPQPGAERRVLGRRVSTLAPAPKQGSLLRWRALFGPGPT